MTTYSRITVCIPKDLDKKLRKIQADKIKVSSRSVSYSSVLADTLRKVLK